MFTAVVISWDYESKTPTRNAGNLLGKLRFLLLFLLLLLLGIVHTFPDTSEVPHSDFSTSDHYTAVCRNLTDDPISGPPFLFQIQPHDPTITNHYPLQV